MTTTIDPAASIVFTVLRALGFVAVDEAALEAPRLVDDSFEQPGNRVRTERSFDGDAADVRQHLFLALRLIHFHAQLLLQLPDLARDARPLIEQPHEYLVDAIDIVAQIVERTD